MPKIPNYSSNHDEQVYGGYKLKHDTKEGMIVEVTKNVPENVGDYNSESWKVEIKDFGHYYELGPISQNKKHMRKIVIRWMKDNPQGWEYNDK